MKVVNNSTRQNLSNRRASAETKIIETVTALLFFVVIAAIIILFTIFNPF